MSWQQDLASARGVVRWTDDVPVADLEEHARAAGRRCVLLDGSDVEDKDGFLTLCEQAFLLPDWFGHNWDALQECLADLDVTGGVLVLWSDWELFAEAEPDEYATAVDVFTDTSRHLAADGDDFVVLLLGALPDEEDDVDLDGPDEGLEELGGDPEEGDAAAPGGEGFELEEPYGAEGDD